jgi:uncharacterized protein (TIGR02246 family)
MAISLEDAASAIATEWKAAWNAHDMARMAALLTEDVDFVNVRGSHWKGRLEVERVHAAMHTTQFHESAWDNHELQTQLLKPDLGLAHLRWSIRGDFDPEGTARTPRSGRFSWLLLLERDRWRIRAAQNTNIVEPASA